MSDATKEYDSEKAVDPEGEWARALEQAEAYFKQQRQELEALHEAFVRVGAPHSHTVFRSLDRLDNLYLCSVAAMQELRWAVLMFDGIRDKAGLAVRRAFATSSEWLASLHDE